MSMLLKLVPSCFGLTHDVRLGNKVSTAPSPHKKGVVILTDPATLWLPGLCALADLQVYSLLGQLGGNPLASVSSLKCDKVATALHPRPMNLTVPQCQYALGLLSVLCRTEWWSRCRVRPGVSS